jgi:hypothetical protein
METLTERSTTNLLANSILVSNAKIHRHRVLSDFYGSGCPTREEEEKGNVEMVSV